ncbi:putative F-box/FBD/LRR-repeat protein At4g13965 [Gastrolobium bilobum]|uniref:putative F-box/FBD/LRR-repeat protein At4g13965 n=1 Tax=Gastrolobium bilobum TaxID=150636 RepID=UPI002AB32574|nr:putative F-box/FBD/LRR-repeat protein At4g13965 [Gastrolobium bilobum]
MMMRRQSQGKNFIIGDNDRLSDLPNAILLHIMSFMKIKDAVQTCILARGWKDLWKSLPNLTLHTSDFRKPSLFSEFVSGIVSSRDGNHPLHNLDFDRHGYFKPQILTNLIRYAVLHDIQHLKIYVPCNISLPWCVFSCQTLKSLHITDASYDVKKRTRIPKSLKLPALVSLHLANVPIFADDNGYAEPFSTCTKLNTLFIDKFALVPPNSHILRMPGILNITNATLANLTINVTYNPGYKFVISTPNLSSFTLNGSPFQPLRGQEGVNVELQSSSLI